MGAYFKWFVILIIYGQTLNANEYWIRYSVTEARVDNEEIRKVIKVVELKSKGSGLDLGTLRSNNKIVEFLARNTENVTGYVYCEWISLDGKIKSRGVPIFGKKIIYKNKEIELSTFLTELRKLGVATYVGKTK